MRSPFAPRPRFQPLAGLLGLGNAADPYSFILMHLRPSTLAMIYAELAPGAIGLAATGAQPVVERFRRAVWAQLVDLVGASDARSYVAAALREVV